MAVQPAPHRFTVEEYYRMAEVGLLHPDARVELLEGEILEMAAIGSRHAECVNRLTRMFITRLGDSAAVSVQNPARLDSYSEPEPDLVLARPRANGYAEAHPGPADVLLLVEVSDTTVGFDRNRKMPLYARAGIAESWLVDLGARAVDRRRQPSKDGYLEVTRFNEGDDISAVFAPDIAFSLDDFLP